METQSLDDPSPLRGLLALLRAGALLALVLVSCGAHAQHAVRPIEKFEKWDFRKRPVTPADLQGLSLSSLEYVRGMIFGKHGRVFRGEMIQDYLDSQDWYKRNPKFSNSVLNNVERASIDVIRGAEAAKHERVLPGDLRFWAKKPIPRAKVKGSLLDLHIMAREIEAIHGKRFGDEPAIQKYFEDRYWYKPAAKYNPKALSPIERQNLRLILDVEKERRKAGAAPGDMPLFETQPLTPDLLRNVGLYDLRLLRNEIYARRGYVFQTPWLSEYFASEEWYEPKVPAEKVELTRMDQRNLGTILVREHALHEALSKRRLKPSEFGDLYLEDLRRLREEIHARRGKVFKTKWLRSYFSSLPWYKPNPSYSPRMLSRVERQNLATIATLENTAESAMNAAEG
jgi:hypothetical protein